MQIFSRGPEGSVNNLSKDRRQVTHPGELRHARRSLMRRVGKAAAGLVVATLLATQTPVGGVLKNVSDMTQRWDDPLPASPQKSPESNIEPVITPIPLAPISSTS
jgi:hypothetical protein